MRRLIAGLVAPLIFASPILAARAALAQMDMRCLSSNERSAVAVAALRSELMVLATACHDDDQYNAFIRKYQPDLLGNEAAIGDLLKREYGRRAQAEHDRFTTEMANAESSAGMRLGEDFCAHDGMLFNEVMALESPSELGAYAAGKDLVPSTLQTCPAPSPQSPRTSPARKVVGRASAKDG
jgi:hypothetical protein